MFCDPLYRTPRPLTITKKKFYIVLVTVFEFTKEFMLTLAKTEEEEMKS